VPMKPAPPVTTIRFPLRATRASLVTPRPLPSASTHTIGRAHVRSDSRARSDAAGASNRHVRPVLSIVVPVYNGGDEIVENLSVIRRDAGGDLPPEDVELIVVSDGSIDGTTERLIE